MNHAEFEPVLEHLHNELATLRTSRANPAVLEDLAVEAYGSTMTLKELALITTPEPQQLLIQPWDQSQIKSIESAIRKSPLQLQPVVDGITIRISFPPLTEERRKELVKLMHQKVEESRIALRRMREEILKALKHQEKEGEMSEDEYFRKEKDIQQAVDSYNEKIKEAADKKEKELLTV